MVFTLIEKVLALRSETLNETMSTLTTQITSRITNAASSQSETLNETMSTLTTQITSGITNTATNAASSVVDGVMTTTQSRQNDAVCAACVGVLNGLTVAMGITSIVALIVVAGVAYLFLSSRQDPVGNGPSNVANAPTQHNTPRYSSRHERNTRLEKVQVSSTEALKGEQMTLLSNVLSGSGGAGDDAKAQPSTSFAAEVIFRPVEQRGQGTSQVLPLL